MLTGRIGAALYRALVGKTLLCLQEQLLAFAAALTALCIKISSQDLCSLDTTLFRRTATVVRYRRNIRNACYFETCGVQRAHCGFATGAWALDANFQILDTAFNSRLADCFGGDLRRERGALTRTLETLRATGRPSQGIALTIRDGHDGIVKGGVNVRDTFGYVLLNFLAHSRAGLCHVFDPLLNYFFAPAMDLRGPLRVRALVRVR